MSYTRVGKGRKEDLSGGWGQGTVTVKNLLPGKEESSVVADWIVLAASAGTAGDPD